MAFPATGSPGQQYTAPSGSVYEETADGTWLKVQSIPTTPAASETQSGTVELATAAETIAGTDTSRGVHPAGVTAAINSLVPTATDSVAGKVELATTAEAATGTDTTRSVTPAGVAAAIAAQVPTATTAVAGKVELATNAEALAGTDTTRGVTPAGMAAYVAANGSGIPTAGGVGDLVRSVITGITNITWGSTYTLGQPLRMVENSGGGANNNDTSQWIFGGTWRFQGGSGQNNGDQLWLRVA